MVPADLGGFIIITIEGKDFDHIFVDEVNICLLLDSLFPETWVPWDFGVEGLLNRLVVFMFGPELSWGFDWTWADGLIRSSHLKIKFPRLRPAVMSLCCMLRWTLSATSNAPRVRLKKRNEIFKSYARITE